MWPAKPGVTSERKEGSGQWGARAVTVAVNLPSCDRGLGQLVGSEREQQGESRPSRRQHTEEFQRRAPRAAQGEELTWHRRQVGGQRTRGPGGLHSLSRWGRESVGCHFFV